MSLFDDAQEEVLYLIWDAAYAPRQEANSIYQMGRFVPHDKSELVARKTIDALVEREFVEWVETKENGLFEISAKGPDESSLVARAHMRPILSASRHTSSLGPSR